MSILDTFITNIPIAEKKRDLFLLPLVNHDLGNIIYEGDIELGKLFFVTSINLLPPHNASEGCTNYCDADDIANLCPDCEAKYIDGTLVKVQALLPVAMFDADNMGNIDLLIGQLDVFRGFIILNTVDICPPAKLSQIYNHYNNLLAQGFVPKYSIMGLVAKNDFKKLPDFVKKSTRLVYRESSLFNDKEIVALRSFYDENQDISEVSVEEFHAARIEAIKLAKASQGYSNIEIPDQIDTLINSKVKNTHNVDKIIEYAEDIYKLAVGTYVAIEGRDTPTNTDVDDILPLVLPKSYTAAGKPESSASPFARKLGGGGLALPKRPVMGATTTPTTQGNGGKVPMQGAKAGINKPAVATPAPRMGATPPAAKQPIMPKQPAPQPITRTPPQQQAAPKAAPATTDIQQSKRVTASHPAGNIIENPYEEADGLAPVNKFDTQGSPSIVKQSISKKSQLPADIADIIQEAKKPAPAEEAPTEEKPAAKAKLPIDIDELLGKSKKEKPHTEAETPKAASAQPVIDMDKILAKGKKQPESSEAPKAAPAKASAIDMDKILAKGKKQPESSEAPKAAPAKASAIDMDKILAKGKKQPESSEAPKAAPAKASAIDMDKILAMGKKSHEDIQPQQVENDFDKILANIENVQEKAPAGTTKTPPAPEPTMTTPKPEPIQVPPTVNPIIEQLLKKGPNSLEANIPENVIDSKSSFVFNPNISTITTEEELQTKKVATALDEIKPTLGEKAEPDTTQQVPVEKTHLSPPIMEKSAPAPKTELPQTEPVFTTDEKAPPEPKRPKTTVRPAKTMTIFFGFDISKNSWSAEIIGNFCQILNDNELIYPIDIGVIVFNDKDSQILLDKTENYAQVVDTLESIVLTGKSNLAEGLKLGEEAVKDYIAKNNSELVSFVVLTDGKSAYSNTPGKSGTELAKNIAHNIFNDGINCWLMDFDNGFLRFGFAEEIAKIAKCRYTLVPSNEYPALLDKINGILSFYKEKYQIK